MHKCRLPSYFWTKTTALHHALWLGQITPKSNISCKCTWTSSTNGGGIHLNHSLNRASSVTLITCSIKWVQPSSQDSKEEMSWYSARGEWVESASFSSQDSRLLKSNFSNSFSCLCLLVMFSVWMPWTLSNTSIMPGCICASGTWLAANTLATGIFFFRVWG